MAKIFFIIFSIVMLPLAAYPGRQRMINLKEQIVSLHKKGDITPSLVLIEEYVKLNDHDLVMKLLHAKTLLFREDLIKPSLDDPRGAEKLALIRQNYSRSAQIFSWAVPYLEKADPRNEHIGSWYFLWAMAEYFSGQKEKSRGLWYKAVKADFTLSDSWYNIAAGYEALGQYADADRYFKKYKTAEQELNEDVEN